MLSAPLTYKIPKAQIHRLPVKSITVPMGFVSDYASIPRLARPLIPSWGRWAEAAVVHDYCYERLCHVMTRSEADKIFLIAMTELKVKWWRRVLMYLAVRIGGRGGWNK
ncbi:MAG: DUF1353 domain-containing protein [Actinobacteria bacterium]|nr:DUF1353 domain-containing protein [Actinomycetota bacterium]